MLLNPDLDNQLNEVILHCGIQPVPEVYAAHFSVVINVELYYIIILYYYILILYY